MFKILFLILGLIIGFAIGQIMYNDVSCFDTCNQFIRDNCKTLYPDFSFDIRNWTGECYVCNKTEKIT